MLLGGLIVVLLAASTATTRHAKDVEVLTTPSGPKVSAKSVDSKIHTKDEGVTEYQLKVHPIKKVELSSFKKDSLSVKPIIKDEGTIGVLKKSTNADIAVPPQKHMNPDSGYDIVTSRKTKRDEGGLDFDDETPLSGRRLRPAATAQASRTSVKKGPNGQDYEYEYVYYYYDDEEDTEGGGSVGDTTPAAKVEPAQITTNRARYSELERAAATGRGSRTEIPETRRPHIAYEEETLPTHIHRGRGREPQEQERRTPAVQLDEDPSRRRQDPTKEDKSRTRYTTIERGRGRTDSNGPLPTTLEPGSNEVLPSRGGHRTRGRIVEQVDDERLPANTRFPTRARAQATTPSPTEPTPSSQKSRGGGSVRRPGVSLVDSSSFRTHSSDSAPDSDQGVAYTPHREVGTPVEPDDIYDVRPTTFSPPQTPATHAPAELPPPLQEQSLPAANGDKAALDLYAILQQTQEENSVTQDEGPSAGHTELLTTELLTTTTTTTTSTTTTTTTPEPTTTTTTTTEPPPPPPPQTGRGRFRGTGGTRTRLRHHSTTTTTEATKEEEPPKRAKFSPSHSRNPSQVSAYGRRGSQRSTTSAPAPEVSSTSAPSRPRVNFAGGNRYRSRPRPGAAQPTEASAAEEPPARDEPSVPANSPTASAAGPPPAAQSGASPLRPRLKVGGPRPLRPGPRINLKGRPGLGGPSTTPAPPTEPAPTEPPQDTVTTTPVPEESEVGNKKRPLRIKPGVGGRPLPVDPVRRRPLPGRRISLPTPQPTATSER